MFRFILIDEPYIGERQARNWPLIYRCSFDWLIDWSIYDNSPALWQVQQSPNFEFALAYLATFCTDLPRACEVEVPEIYQFISITLYMFGLSERNATGYLDKNHKLVSIQQNAFSLSANPSCLAHSYENHQWATLLQAALQYVTVRYKLNPFKTMHQVQAGINISSSLYFINSRPIQATPHARHGVKRKVTWSVVLHHTA